ncbi:MAG: hypothetical protein EOO15_16660 [Chitinophagaceae bacterium]|nr:MAG: hypothetical protein EOO15_16660 [Chitinophagaceae bacterium]
MAYQIEAFIGPQDSMQLLAARFPAAQLVPLGQSLFLCPLTDALYDELNTSGSSQRIGSFSRLSQDMEIAISQIVGDKTIGYIEADYFGGSGGQVGTTWKGGKRGRIEGPGQSCINTVLWSLGAIGVGGKDVFESVGLDRHRSTEDWLEDLPRVVAEPPTDAAAPKASRWAAIASLFAQLFRTTKTK